MEYLHLHETASRKVMAEELGVEDKKMERALKALVTKKQVERLAGGRSTIYRAIDLEE